ncbi:hypothetical protein APR08_000035 [Nocardia amikacinitolerans]|nr:MULTISPECIES: hypothetical protein [Nocardia]MCP2287132.1 hypothetical protein [Nocardia amikacinitolerans]
MLGPVTPSDMPQRDINMASGGADGGSHCQEQGLIPNDIESRVEPEFLACFPPRRSAWVFAGSQVPAHREFETGFAVSTEVDAALGGVDQDHVRDQVLRWSRWWNSAEDVIGLGEPGQCLLDVLLFNLVDRRDRGNKISDGCGGGLHVARA